MSFGEGLKKIRNKNGDSLRSLAEKIGVSHVYISQIEKAQTPASKNFLDKLVKVYKSDEQELLKLYLDDVLPEALTPKLVYGKNATAMSQTLERIKLINTLLEESTTKDIKEILELMLLQRELEAKKTKTYEKRKTELDELRKEIDKI